SFNLCQSVYSVDPSLRRPTTFGGALWLARRAAAQAAAIESPGLTPTHHLRSSFIIPPLLHAQQLDLAHQVRPRRDRWRASPLAVAQLPRALQPPLPADLHARNPLLPPLNEVVQAKLDGLASVVARIELPAVGQRALVVHLDR